MANLKIVSGGQTGVDQGALEAAARLGLEFGGWARQPCGTDLICLRWLKSLRMTRRFLLYYVRSPEGIGAQEAQ